METIEIHNLTKDYGFSRGIFGIDLTVKQGEMMGFVGTNGSGKTTTIRSLLGFIKPTSGNAYVNGLESWENSSEIVKSVGYVPGEIAFPDLATGTEFLRCQAEFLGLKDMTYANELIKKLQLDPRANLKRMSKGMKQKTALVCALMNNSPILIFDEPTTGLDPVMSRIIDDLIVKMQTLLNVTSIVITHDMMSVFRMADRVVMLYDGKIIEGGSPEHLHEIEEPHLKFFFMSSIAKKGEDIETIKPLD